MGYRCEALSMYVTELGPKLSFSVGVVEENLGSNTLKRAFVKIILFKKVVVWALALFPSINWVSTHETIFS